MTQNLSTNHINFFTFDYQKHGQNAFGLPGIFQELRITSIDYPESARLTIDGMDIRDTEIRIKNPVGMGRRSIRSHSGIIIW